MKKIIIEFIIMFTTIIILFNINVNIKNEVYKTTIYFIKNVIPSLFPLMIISLYLKNNVLNKSNNKFLYLLISFFTYAPSNALITDDSFLITCSCIVNPLFIYNVISNIVGRIVAIKIIITNIIVNYTFIVFKIIKTNYTNNHNNEKKLSLTKVIKKTTDNIINIYGITIFFTIINNILIFIKIPLNLIIFTDIINGFKLINEIKRFKLLSIIIINSFTGLSILFQIKSINEKISYKFILYKFMLSILSLILTLIIISL